MKSIIELRKSLDNMRDDCIDFADIVPVPYSSTEDYEELKKALDRLEFLEDIFARM